MANKVKNEHRELDPGGGMKYTYARKLMVNAKIARELNNWMCVTVAEWVGGVAGRNERISYWHTQDATRIVSVDDYAPTDNTEQAFELLIEYDLLGSNIGYLMAAGVEVEDLDGDIKYDPHQTTRLIICEAALAVAFSIKESFNKYEERDYAY